MQLSWGTSRQGTGIIAYSDGALLIATLSQEDRSFLDAALRETKEEVGIDPSDIQLLGEIGPPELSLAGLRVWPYIVCSTFTISILDFLHGLTIVTGIRPR